jgi:FkbM family methyltransferase
MSEPGVSNALTPAGDVKSRHNLNQEKRLITNEAVQRHSYSEKRESVVPLLKSVKSLSFSQYGEDLMLAVSLLPGRRGRYVDVGAYHPWRTSNTYKLYLRGWSGVTIEPNPDVAPLFRRVRPRDAHVVSGVAPEVGELTYYRFADGKLNTFSEGQARVYLDQGAPGLDPLRVACRPLQDILDEHACGPIDLLSIDCEGYDLAALQSLDFGRCRPTAVIIEDYEAFEKLKTGAGNSQIEVLLRAKAYAPVGQTMYSSLYVDLEALKARRSAAFDLSSVQFA